MERLDAMNYLCNEYLMGSPEGALGSVPLFRVRPTPAVLAKICSVYVYYAKYAKYANKIPKNMKTILRK